MVSEHAASANPYAIITYPTFHIPIEQLTNDWNGNKLYKVTQQKWNRTVCYLIYKCLKKMGEKL